MVGGMHGRGVRDRGVHARGTCMAGGHVWQGGMCGVAGGAIMAGEMATATDGTHPTGMHSCQHKSFDENTIIRHKFVKF